MVWVRAIVREFRPCLKRAVVVNFSGDGNTYAFPESEVIGVVFEGAEGTQVFPCAPELKPQDRGSSRTVDLTADEQVYLEKLVDSWNCFLKLGGHREDVVQDFRDAIHRCQATLALRLVQRACPGTWNVT